MASFVKTKLKAARDFIAKKDYAKAKDAVAEVLSYEPDNYNANVFLGLASLETGDYEQSEQAYQSAIKSNSEQILAWQGLSKFYERTEKWDKYAETLKTVMDLYAKADDATKCAEALQRYIEFWRQRGSRKEIIDSLSLLLPQSPLYSVLSALPVPDPTAPTATTIFPTQCAMHNSLPNIEEIVTLTEKDEDEFLKKEVDKRRMRLGSAGPEELRKEVGLVLWGSSKLPELYDEIISHPNTSDELRRLTESKLLRYKYRYLCALPASGDAVYLKLKIAAEVQALIDGIVLLNIPDEFAWTLYIEGNDTGTLEGYDYNILRRFMNLFSALPLSRMIHGYFLYTGLSLSEDEDDNSTQQESDLDPFDIMLEAFTSLPDSILAHRILGEIYISDEDYANAVPVAEKGLELVRHQEADTAKKLTQVQKALNITLATGLVYLFPPKHHARAVRVLDDVLELEPNNAPCLMGRGSVLQTAGKWREAAALFEKVMNLLSDDINIGLVAREERAWCLVQCGTPEDAVEELQAVLNALEALDGYELKKARMWWRLGECYWRLGEGSREKSYKHFITSLKRSPSFAPAFTSLGIYYLEFTSPPDPTRATKCFQKAFELDARETDAAKRLAHSFAEEREWDLVEVVARRTIEGEGGLGGGLGAVEASAIAKHKPTNIWAWKALGVVELNRRNYPAAIQAFQVTLRSGENDALSWLRLGEAYTKAGRHAAAIKALNKSLELLPEDWMCLYQIGEVQYQTGQLPQAIVTFSSILETNPSETAVLLSLAETHVSLGRLELATGYIGRSSASFLSAISTSLSLMKSGPGFRRLAWKTIVDALFALSDFSNFGDDELAHEELEKVVALLPNESHERIAGLADVPAMSGTTIIDGTFALKLAIVSSNYRLSLFAMDEDGIGSAWFDLGVSLSRLAAIQRLETVHERATKQAIECVRLALVSEPGNPTFWNAFGTFNFTAEPMIAQHAYIKALEIDSKDANVWTNLGLLYLQNDDSTLANEAFLKAQTLDPDFTLAWVGQGLVATANGHEEDAGALFEHAVGLTADLPEADFEYSYRMFLKLPYMATGNKLLLWEALLPPFFSLDRYCRRKSTDPSALHLFGLVCERLHHEELGVQMISRAIKLLEAVYEETEDPQVERRYAIANTNLGRLLVASGDLPAALETFETAFNLLSADDVNEEIVTLRTMCQFGCGIAQFRLGNLEEAMSMFESAQDIAVAHPTILGQVTVLLAQTLWAIGSEEFRESAKNQLLDCINTNPENLAAVTALSAMGLLTDDEALIDAAVTEILTLPIDERHRRDPERDVDSLLASHHLAEGNVTKALEVVQQAVHAEPSRIEGRFKLASLLLPQARPEITQALLSKLPAAYNSSTDSHRQLRLLAIALVSAKNRSESRVDARNLAQRAVMMAPWDSANWLCLAYVQNTRR